jgi:hypothetical protein
MIAAANRERTSPASLSTSAGSSAIRSRIVGLAFLPVAFAGLRARYSHATAAVKAGRAAIALTIEEREQILRRLEDCPDGLAELRGVLAREHEWRVEQGLVWRVRHAPPVSRAAVAGSSRRMAIPDDEFETMLARAWSFRRRIDDLRSVTGHMLDESVRERRAEPVDYLSPDQRELAEEIARFLADPRLSALQAARLERAVFER